MSGLTSHRVSARFSRFKPRGFTLLEILVATAMFAVLIGAVYSAFYGALRLRENAYEAFEAELPRSYVVNKIKQDLVNIVAPVGLMAGAMIGEKNETGTVRLDRLEIHTSSGSVTESAYWGDIQKVEYYLEEPENPEDQANPDNHDLVRAVTRNLLASTEEEPEQERLLHGVRSLEFSYYDGEQWLDSWDSTTQENETPMAVRVRIDFVPVESGERQVLPVELVVPIVTKTAGTEASGEEGSGAPSPAGGTGGGR